MDDAMAPQEGATTDAARATSEPRRAPDPAVASVPGPALGDPSVAVGGDGAALPPATSLDVAPLDVAPLDGPQAPPDPGPDAALGPDPVLPLDEVLLPPLDDPLRLAAVDALGLLDEPVETAFERATRIASTALGTPVALVTLVTADRQFFVAQHGLEEPWASARQTPLSHSFCQLVVTGDAPLEVSDARRDPRVAGNGAIEDLGVSAYLGVPVRSPDGRPLGAFCVIDVDPREWTEEERELVTELARSVQRELDLRAALLTVSTVNRELDDVLATLLHDLDGPVSTVLGGVERLRMPAHTEPDEREALVDALLAQTDRARMMVRSLQRARRGVRPEDAPVDFVVSDVIEARLAVDAARAKVTWDVDVEVRLPAETFNSLVANLLRPAFAAQDEPLEVEVRTSEAGVTLTLHTTAELAAAHEVVDPATPLAELDGVAASAGVVRRRLAELGGRLHVRTEAGGNVVEVVVPTG